MFGLGAILCEVLTGGPPFRRPGLSGLLQQAREADLADATAALDHCGADAELVRLAMDCLAAAPADRPADGAAVAARLGTHLAGVQERFAAPNSGRRRAERGPRASAPAAV